MKRSIGARTYLYPTPVMVIGTYDQEGRPNMMTAAWGGICCSKPPCLSVSLRAATYSHGNIMRNKAFTASLPSVDFVDEADYIGMASGRQEDKFRTTGLTPVRSELVNAPYVEQFPLALECKLVQVHELGLHTQFIGEILDVKAEADCLDGDVPLVERLRPFIFDPGTATYRSIGDKLAQGFSTGKKIKR